MHDRHLAMIRDAHPRVHRLAVDALPARVPLVPLYAGVEASDVARILAADPDGAVIVGTGEGSVPIRLTRLFDLAMRRGTVLVVASTCELGATSQALHHARRPSGPPGEAMLTQENPWKARIRLQVLLSAERSHGSVRHP
jgi:L-asparaginase/Glu-tRNA(Gln) amidotransferase subunit D